MTDTIAVAEAIKNGEHDDCLREIGKAVDNRTAELDPTQALSQLVSCSQYVDEAVLLPPARRPPAVFEIATRLRNGRFPEHPSALVRDYHEVVKRKVMATLIDSTYEH